MRVMNPKDYDLEEALKKKRLRQKMYGFKGENLEVALKKAERSDIVCPLTGDNDLLDTAENLVICDKCFRKFKSYIGVKAKPIYPTGIGGKSRCDLCGRYIVHDTLKGIPSWYIIQMPCSIKAMWHILGKKNKPLKIFGDTIVY